jgi:hypothetical protein
MVFEVVRVEFVLVPARDPTQARRFCGEVLGLPEAPPTPTSSRRRA